MWYLCLCTYLICITDVPGGRDLPSYFGREDERGSHLVVKDSDTIGASYDRYLRVTVCLLTVQIILSW